MTRTEILPHDVSPKITPFQGQSPRRGCCGIIPDNSFHFKKKGFKNLTCTLTLALVAALSLSCVYPVYDGDDFALEERHSVWQYLSVFSIYQDRVPPAPGNLTPYDMFDMISDSLGRGRYTEYLDDRPGGGGMFSPATVFEDPEAFTESTVYIRIPEFSDTALSFWMSNVNFLAGFPNIVIDLRGNGGGLLSVADAMVSEFVTLGTQFINTRHRRYDADRLTGVTVEDGGRRAIMPNPRLLGKNITVIVDGGSASASEIMAAALVDFAEANLVGLQTFGKGIGQGIFYRPERKTLSVTLMEIFGMTDRTGRSHTIGIEPDPVNEEFMNEAVKAGELLSVDPLIYYAVKLLEPDMTLENGDDEEFAESLRRMRQVTETTRLGLAKQAESGRPVIGAFLIFDYDPFE
ncbi:MAG: S41 family peptidase [Chitinispirillales bacterium]|jgi:hypothetical protein|nr:S41 family peptidase [Chitinispirillales bacterium]